MFGGCFVVCFVFFRWVEDGNVEVVVGVDVGMEGDWCLEGERGREVGVLRWEVEFGVEIFFCGVD